MVRGSILFVRCSYSAKFYYYTKANINVGTSHDAEIFQLMTM